MGPGRRVVFRPDHSKDTGFGGFILSDDVRDATEEVAKDIAVLAGHLAPRRKDRGIVPEGTAMADRFRVKRDAGTIRVSRNVRVKVEVYNEAPSAAPMEFGNSHTTTRHRMLGRAGAAFGDFKHSGEGPLRNDGTF